MDFVTRFPLKKNGKTSPQPLPDDLTENDRKQVNHLLQFQMALGGKEKSLPEQLPFTPDVAIPPGETLLETMDAFHLRKPYVAHVLGLSEDEFDELAAGDRPITREMAQTLEKMFGIPMSFWMNLEHHYQTLLEKGVKKWASE